MAIEHVYDDVCCMCEQADIETTPLSLLDYGLRLGFSGFSFLRCRYSCDCAGVNTLQIVPEAFLVYGSH